MSDFLTFLLTGLTIAPFAVLALLAYLGARHLLARIGAILWLAGLMGLTALFAVGFSYACVKEGWIAGAAALGALIALACGAVVWIPSVRLAAARIIPIDPNSFVHAVALSATVAFSALAFVPLLILCQPPMLMEGMLDKVAESQKGGGGVKDVLGLLWIVPASFFCVGWPVARRFREALERLGVARLSLKAAGAAVAIALLLYPVMTSVDWLVSAGWKGAGWSGTDMHAFGKLISYAGTWPGAIALAFCAGVGEELAVRGVLQPRLGIILSNLFFTSLHAFQYHWDGLLQVFLIGCLLGLLRKRTSTTFTMVVHGGYDFVLCAAGILGL